MSQSSYDRDLDRNAANFQPLTPLTFLERAAEVFPDRLAIAHGPLRRNYRDFHARSKKLASALAKRGIVRGDTVAVMLANTPAMLECHYGVPMCGAVLNTLNTRLDAAALAFMLDHGEAKALDRRPRVFRRDGVGAEARQGPPARHRLRRSGIRRPGRADRRDRLRGARRRGRRGLSARPRRSTNGTRSRSTTLPGRPATPRASSTTIAAPICSRWATSSPPTWAAIRSICGRCRCSIATAGAFPGRSASRRARMSA